MTSTEIAQLFAAQNQMFMGQAQYANQIGTSGPASSIGSWGSASSMGPPMMAMPGFRPPPRPISFAPSGLGSASYGPGSQFAGTAMSAFGGASSMMTTGSLREAAMGVGVTGAIGGITGGLAGTGFMAGAGAAMLPALPLAGAAYGAGKLLNTFMGGGQQQQMIQSQLGSFGHMNPASRTGTGFTRDDAMAIGSSIRALANVPEMMTSVEELTRMIPKLKSMGVMQGVRDASEFTSRFRETIKTVRDVSKLLGTTMEEASEFFAHSRGVGFMGRQAQIQNVLSAQFTSGMTGMTMGQTMQLQAGGAAMARQVGGRGAQGATAVTNIAQRIEMARQSGRITEEMIQDVTGQSGAEGVGAASQRMYELMLNMRNSAAGRLIMAGAMKKDASGKVVLDDDAIKRLNNGELGVDDLKRKASRLSDEDKISFMYRAQGSLGAQFAGSVDIGSFMQRLVGNRGRDAAARVLQMQGIGGNEQDIDMLMQVGGGAGPGQQRAFAERQARESYISQQTDPSKIFSRIKTRMFNASGLAGLQNTGAKAFNEIGKAYDEFVDDLVGRQVVSISKEGAERLHRAFVGTNRGDLKKLFGEAYGIKGEGLAALAQSGTGGVGGGFSTVGGALGGMAGVTLAGLTGGASLALGTNRVGSAINRMLGTGNIRDTELAALVTGERTSAGQLRHQQGMLGGVSAEAVAGAGMGTEAKNQMINLARGIPGFAEMSEAQKLDALREAAAGNLGRGTGAGAMSALGGAMLSKEAIAANIMLPGVGGALVGAFSGIKAFMGSKNEALERAADEIQKKTGIKDRAAAVALASGLINPKGLASKSDVFAIESTAALAKKIRAATDEVTSALGDEGATLIKNKPEARRLLMDLQDNPELAAILHAGGSDEEVIDKLKAKGYSVDQGDLHTLRNADQKMTESGKGKSIKESISNMVRSQAQGDINVMKKQAGDVAKGVTDSALKSALMHFSESGVGIFTTDDKGNATGAEIGVQKAVEALVQQAAGTSGKTRERILASAGQLRDAVESGVAASKTLGMTAEQVGRQFHLSAEDLASIGLTPGKKVTQGMVGKLQTLAEKAATSGIVAGAGTAATSGDKDAKLMEILNKIDKTLDLNTTVIQATSGDSKLAAEAKAKLAKMNEKPDSDAKGATKV